MTDESSHHIGQRLENTGTATDPWPVCLCGNQPDQAGFVACDAVGAKQADDGNSPTDDWDGVHILCSCGAVVRQSDLVVVAVVAVVDLSIPERVVSAPVRPVVHLGTIAREIREGHMTRQAFAAQVNLSLTDYRRWEEGRMVLNTAQLRRVLQHPIMVDLAQRALAAGIDPGAQRGGDGAS